MSENPNLENLLQMGITAAKEGNNEGARMLLKQVLDADKKNDRAWVWMAYITTDSVKRRQYLQTALKINPGNTAAKKALSKINKKRSSTEERTIIIAGVFTLGLLSLVVVLVVVALLA